MSASRAISLEALQQVYSRDELARLVARRGTTGAADFLAALHADLDDAIRNLEDAAEHYANDDAEKLTHFLASQLRTLGYNASSSMQEQGCAVLKIENNAANILWLAAAALHSSHEQDIERIVQLLGAMSGRHVQAGFILYVRDQGAANILENWVKTVQDTDRLGCRAVTPSDSYCVFTSQHTHSSGFSIGIRHHAVLLNRTISRKQLDRARPPRRKRTILFLAADPSGTSQPELERDARAIQTTLDLSGYGDCFEFTTRWAVEPRDLLHELRKLEPSMVHFGGWHHDVASRRYRHGEQPAGIFLRGSDGRPQLVSIQALEETFGAAGASVELIVLSGCYTEAQAAALLTHVGYVIGMSGSIGVEAARAFARGFYGGIGHNEPIATAFKQGCAAIQLEGLPAGDLPQLRIRSA